MGWGLASSDLPGVLEAGVDDGSASLLRGLDKGEGVVDRFGASGVFVAGFWSCLVTDEDGASGLVLS